MRNEKSDFVFNMDGYISHRIAIPPSFEEVFSHFYYAENKTGETVVKTLMPSYQTIMIFSFGTPASFIAKNGEEITVEKCIVLGPIKHSFTYSLAPGAEIFVCNFKDDAFFRFFTHADLSRELAVHPDDLLHQNCFTLLWSELKQLSCNEKRTEMILNFARPYLRNRDQIAGQIAGFDSTTSSAIKEISHKNKLSERSIQLNHKKHFGYTAKEFHRYKRFLKAIQLLQTIASESQKVDWFEIIAACEYYDQSQLIKDFNHYLQLSPAKYLKFQEAICNPKL